MAQMTPEVRQDILNSLSITCHLWMEEVLKSFFDNPHDPAAHQVLIEALANGLQRTARSVPNGGALLHTFALEVLDNVNKQGQ
jgi:hypothetical protein